MVEGSKPSDDEFTRQSSETLWVGAFLTKESLGFFDGVILDY